MIKILIALLLLRVFQKGWNWVVDYNHTYTIDYYWIFVITAFLIYLCLWLIHFGQNN